MDATNNKPIKEEIDFLYRIKEDILPHIATPLHYHPHYELVWIKKGYGKRIVGDSQDNFQEGDMVLVCPNLPHEWKNDEVFYEGNPNLFVDVFVIHFTQEIIRQLIQIPELESIVSILKMSKRGILIKGETMDRISSIMEKLITSDGISKVVLLLQIFEQISCGKNDLSLLASDSFLSYFEELKTPRLRKVDEYISVHFKNDIKIKEIADYLCMTPSSFCRYFKQKTGMNFVNYLTDYRLRYAKSLLDSNKYKITTIATMSGFNNVTYFNRVFKQNTSMTPSEYIQSIQV